MKYKTDCPCYSEVNMGNPGGVPHCSQYGLEPDCENCKRPKRTKADRVRAMTDNELAEYMATREAAMADVIFGIAERVLMEKRGYKISFTDHFKPDLLQMKREYLAMLQQEDTDGATQT